MKNLIKIFLVWILLQFFLQTLITFGLGINIEIIWLWKEFFIIVFFFYLCYLVITKKQYKTLFKDKSILWLEILFLLQVILAFLINILILKTWISQFILAFKYDFLGFLIFFIFVNLSQFLDHKFIKKILFFFGKVLKIVLISAIFWYALILLKPSFLYNLWYDNNIYEWTAWQRPPAVYKTQQYYGYPRNQFLFERPISFGFFLVAFWPLFYLLYIRSDKSKNKYLRLAMYGLNIILTFSRAAWWAWFVQIILIGLLFHAKDLKKFIIKFLLPFIIAAVIIWVVWYKQIISRDFSNTWHLQLLKQWFTMFLENPLFGKWAWYVWPASHWWGIAFNPENQYIQILIEFGIIIFIFWMLIYAFLNMYPIIKFIKVKYKENMIFLITLSIWMIWLSIQWFVLHSFVDRMIVYPFMLLLGLSRGYAFFSQKSE